MRFSTDDPGDLHAAAVRAIAKGDDAKALTLYRSAARLDPKNPMHALRAGDCLARLGRDAEAAAVYREVAERYAAVGQHARAISVYRMVQRLAPRDAAAARRLVELRARREETREVPERDRHPVPAELAALFPVLELEDRPAPAPAPPPADAAALEATVRVLLAELLRAQREIEALKARLGESSGATC